MKEIIINTVDGMLNAPYLYGGNPHYIRSYSMNDDSQKFTLITDKKRFTRPYENVLEFLNLFEPLPDNAPAVIQNPKGLYIPALQVGPDVVRHVRDILLENIQKVKDSKEYIPQAEAVKANVDSIISLAKTEIEYLQTIEKLNR